MRRVFARGAVLQTVFASGHARHRFCKKEETSTGRMWLIIGGGIGSRKDNRTDAQFDMLEKNLESGRVGGDQKVTGRCGRETLWALMFAVTLIALFPVGLAGQTPALGALGPPQAPAFGNNAQTPLQFAGESAPGNQVTLSFGASTLYDDNVLARNSQRLSDEAVSFTSNLGISSHTERLAINFDYIPFFLLYRQVDQYDRLNHSANLRLTYRLASRFFLGLHDAFRYQNGVYPSLTEQQIMSGPASPTALNQRIYSYTTRTLSNTPGLDLTFVKSSRTSVTLSGGYSQRKFGNQTGEAETLYNSDGVSGGLQFQYRVTDHTSFGLLLLHQDTTYQGGEIIGNRQRSQIESAYFSVGSSLSPTVTVNVFGGPQYVRTLGQSSAGSSVPGQFEGAGGGSITKEVGKTALNLALQRSVSDGAGLYTSVINTNATFGVRRRLVGHWEADLHGGATRADASLIQLANERTDALTGAIDFSRPLRGGSVLHISYDTTHQLSKGNLPVSADFDRNVVTIGFDYRLKAISLGR